MHSVSYLVSTRLIAGLIAIIPLYSLSVLAAFGTSGTLAKGLLGAGWSPAAAVTVRTASRSAPDGKPVTTASASARAC